MSCRLMTHEEGGEADKGGYRGAGIGAPGARHVGEHVVVRALGGNGPLFVAADFFLNGQFISAPISFINGKNNRDFWFFKNILRTSRIMSVELF